MIIHPFSWTLFFAVISALLQSAVGLQLRRTGGPENTEASTSTGETPYVALMNLLKSRETHSGDVKDDREGADKLRVLDAWNRATQTL